MQKEILNYILHTPINFNRNVAEGILGEQKNNPISKELYDYLERQGLEINKMVIKEYINQIFENFSTGKTYTLRINTTDSNPLSCCEYMDDALGMVKGSSEWDNQEIFKDIRPCVFKEGQVVYYLNPLDFSQKEDGGSAVLTGEDGDVMIEFNKFAYRIYNEGDYTYISISNDAETIANDLRFVYLPFSRTNGKDIDKIYIGAYQGVIIDNKLRSVSGQLPTTSQTLQNFRTAAHENGQGYENFTFYQITMLQCLSLIRYGNLNIQAALGQGFVSAGKLDNTGALNNSGMYFGDPDNDQTHMKFAGIEDFYGNTRTLLEGVYCDENYHILVATDNFNETMEDYLDLGAISVNKVQGIIKTLFGESKLGFFPKTVTDYLSTESYFSDLATISSNSIFMFGSGHSHSVYGGPFFLEGMGQNDKRHDLGGRLSYY